MLFITHYEHSPTPISLPLRMIAFSCRATCPSAWLRCGALASAAVALGRRDPSGPCRSLDAKLAVTDLYELSSKTEALSEARLRRAKMMLMMKAEGKLGIRTTARVRTVTMMMVVSVRRMMVRKMATMTMTAMSGMMRCAKWPASCSGYW